MKIKFFLMFATLTLISTNVLAMELEIPGLDQAAAQHFLTNIRQSIETMGNFFRENPESCPNVWVNDDGQIGIWNENMPQNAIVICTREINETIKRIMTTYYPNQRQQSKVLVQYLRDKCQNIVTRPQSQHSRLKKTIICGSIFIVVYIMMIIASFPIWMFAFDDPNASSLQLWGMILAMPFLLPIILLGAGDLTLSPEVLVVLAAVGVAIYFKVFHNTHDGQPPLDRSLENLNSDNPQLRQLAQNLIAAYQEVDRPGLV